MVKNVINAFGGSAKGQLSLCGPTNGVFRVLVSDSSDNYAGVTLDAQGADDLRKWLDHNFPVTKKV